MVRNFLTTIFPPALSVGLGFRSIFCTDTRRTRFFPVEDIEESAKAVVGLDQTGKDMYVGISLLKSEPRKGRGTVQDVSAVPGFVADIDIRGPTHPSTDYPPTIEKVGELLDDVGIQPTLVINSGYGIHVWWLFEKPFVVTDENRSGIVRRFKDFGSVITTAGLKRGWKIDTVSDLARVLRIPGTHNHAKKVTPKPEPKLVTILIDDGPRIPVDVSFLTSTQSVQAHVSNAAIEQSRSTGKVLDIQDVKSRLRHLKDLETRVAAIKIINGEIFAEHGKRDETLLAVTAAIARIALWNDPRELAEIFVQSLSVLIEKHPDKHPESLEELIANVVDKIERAQEKYRPLDVLEKEQEERIRQVILRRTRAEFPPPGVSAEKAGTLPVEGGANPGGGLYTDEEVAKFAADAGVSVEEFHKQWVIQKGRLYYVFVNGAYRQPKIKEELEHSLNNWLAPAETYIQLTSVAKNGSIKPKSTRDILLGITTCADKVIADMTIEKSFYDRLSRTFHERVCVQRDIAAKYDDKIDRWLRLLGGSDSEKLLDWVATVTRLEVQTAALYLSGAAGAGKSMLVHGLARIWSTEGPVELERVIQGFNYELINCPLVVADEEMPQLKDGTSITGRLRSAIGNDSRTLARKFHDNSTLRGCFRIILCANNDEMLSSGEMVLAALDLKAVAGRILHVDVPIEAAEYLASIGGRTGTHNWVSGDCIAAHALWLKQNRNVESGNRFLVEGHETKMHRKLAVQGRVSARCIEWLARYLNDPRLFEASTQSAPILIQLGDGKFLVNTSVLVDNWNRFAAKGQTQPQPSTTLIGRALTNLSGEVERVGEERVRYHSIRAEQVIEWAEENQIGSVDRMRYNLSSPKNSPKWIGKNKPSDAPATVTNIDDYRR